MTLLIIDMQECYVNYSLPHYISVITNVAKEINSAKLKNEYIIFLEYYNSKILYQKTTNNYLPSLKELRDLVIDYENILYVFKKSTDGGTEVAQTLKENNINSDIRVCGAYAEACVSETVHTLSIKLKDSKIELIKNALASSYNCKYMKQSAINFMISLENVF